MKALATTSALFIALILVLGTPIEVMAQDFVGSSTCINCHKNMQPDLVAEYEKSGHPYKLNEVNGGPPAYPAHTSPGVPNPPPGTAWSDYQYVIGGYGWKARFVKPDGRIFTAGTEAQFNLETEGWVAYHQDEDKKYNFSCFQCHTTGPSEEGSWNGVADDSLGTFSEPGVRCEGCHGAGSDHAANPSGVKPPYVDDDLKINRCGDCHQRGGATNAIPASGNYIRHHEQVNEMRASRHGDGAGAELTCASCHNAHIPLRYPDAAGEGFEGIGTQCESCHPGQEILVNDTPKNIACTDCHMAPASKSAVGMQMGNGWRGDVKTHIMAINTAAVTREAMFTEDGGLVKLDAEGLAAVTLDFACLGCHTEENVSWAASYADGIHENGIVTGVEDEFGLPKEFALDQNYPNPFNPSTSIAFKLPKSAPVTLFVYSLNGQLVQTLLDQSMPAGSHTVQMNAQSLASGVYLYRLTAGEFVSTKALTLLK